MGLLLAAWSVLRPDLVYSTCTFAPEENVTDNEVFREGKDGEILDIKILDIKRLPIVREFRVK